MLLEEFPFEPGFRLTDGDLLNKVAAEPAYSVDNTVTATGTTQALAYGIRATVTVVTAGGDNAGLRLPFPKVGRIIFVLNYTATGKRVYPHDAELINGVGFADMPFQMGMVLICTSFGSWAASLTETNTSGDVILVASDADTSTGDGHFVEISGGAGGTTSGAGGSVSISGGPGTPDGSVTIAGSPVNVQGIIFLSAEGSIQAAIDALPANGGMIMLAAGVTYVVTTAIVSNKPNVHLTAPGWSTVIQRGPVLTGVLLQLSGAGCLIEGMTLDGNGVVNTSGPACPSEVQIAGAGSRITNIQVINSSAQLNIAVSGDHSRVDHCSIIGRGVDLGTERGDGIWIDTTNQVTIDHNYISGTGLSAVFASGNGTIIDANFMKNCRCYAGGPGGIIGTYPNVTGNTSVTITNNVIQGCGSLTTGGIEVYGNNLTITGNTVLNMSGSAIGVGNVGTSSGVVITGNNILNTGLDNSGNQDGITIGTGVTDFIISGNRVSDNHTPPKMRWAVAVTGVGVVDRYNISGNLFGPVAHGAIIADSGVGISKVVSNNSGLDTSQQIAYFPVPSTMRVLPSDIFHLLNPGTIVPITAIDAPNTAAGAVKTVFPNAAFTFQAGNNINNTITTTANVPFTMTCDSTGKWWLR